MWVKAAEAGMALNKNTKGDLEQMKTIFGEQDFSYSNIADRVANEILQCSIDFFNDSQEKHIDNNYHETAIRLVKFADSTKGLSSACVGEQTEMTAQSVNGWGKGQKA